MKTLWQLPYPSSGGVDSRLTVLPGRECVLVIAPHGGGEEGQARYSIAFHDVAGYRCTYWAAMTAQMVAAYDRLADMEASEWIAEVGAAQQGARAEPSRRHYRICLDDGPCYDVLAASFEIHAHRDE